MGKIGQIGQIKSLLNPTKMAGTKQTKQTKQTEQTKQPRQTRQTEQIKSAKMERVEQTEQTATAFTSKLAVIPLSRGGLIILESSRPPVAYNGRLDSTFVAFFRAVSRLHDEGKVEIRLVTGEAGLIVYSDPETIQSLADKITGRAKRFGEPLPEEETAKLLNKLCKPKQCRDSVVG